MECLFGANAIGQTYISSYGDENLIAQNVIHKHITQLRRELS